MPAFRPGCPTSRRSASPPSSCCRSPTSRARATGATTACCLRPRWRLWSPGRLKRLIDAAHGLGLMVYLDAVYNHFGPAGNYLHAYAKTFFTERHQPLGRRHQLRRQGERRHGAPVLHPERPVLAGGISFRRPALRRRPRDLDDSPRHFLAELGETIRKFFSGPPDPPDAGERGQPGPLAGARRRRAPEDARRPVGRRPAPLLARPAHRRGCGYYKSFADKPVAHIARCLAEGFAYQGEPFSTSTTIPRRALGHLPPSSFVTFLLNHDQVGNRALGERLNIWRPEEARPRPGRAPAGTRRSRCSGWARNGRPRRRSCSSSTSRRTRS